MKMKPQHYDHLKMAIARVWALNAARYCSGSIKGLLDDCREKLRLDRRVKDVEKRLRWDSFYAAGLARWACDMLYSYLDDTHIDTALRRVMAETDVAS